MPTSEKPWDQDVTELPDGTLVCTDHQLTVCGICCVDYTFMEENLDDEEEGHKDAEDDDEKPLTAEELANFRADMIARKGCACFLPLAGSGCENCDSQAKSKGSSTAEKNRDAAAEKTKCSEEKMVHAGGK